MKSAWLITLLLLSSCSWLPSSFDNMEHSYLVTLNQLSADARACDDPARAVYTSQQLLGQAQWLHRYGSSLPRNSQLMVMEQNLLNMSRELADRYHSGSVSPAYCRSKLDNIHRATETIIEVSGKRPRL